MDAYREIIEPTRVSHCIGCNFISPNAKNLIVAKSTLLQVFEIKKLVNGSYKLKLIEQFKLHGKVTDIKAIRTIENPNLDYVLVSTKFAKMSLIKWNHRYHSISTVSLHYYENAIKNYTYEALTETQLILEPNANSCACLRFKNILVLLPFATPDEDSDIEDLDSKTVSNLKKHSGNDTSEIYYPSFVMNGSLLDSGITDIVDMQFLYNYREPTLAILYVSQHTWAGNLPNVKDNVNFMIISLDLETKSTTTVLKVENLPYDIDRIVPLPQPFNGSLLLGCNEIIHIDSGGISRRIAVNKYTEIVTNSVKSYLDQSDLNLNLEYCSITPIPNDHRLLMVLQNGEFCFINFAIDGKSIKKIYVEPILKGLYQDMPINYPGDMAILENGLIFVSNKNGDSHLIEVTYETESNSQIIKEKILESNNEDNMEEDDEDDLYGDEDKSEKEITKKGTIVFVKHDSLFNNGPVTNFTLGHYSLDKFKANLVNPSYQEISIVASSGSGSEGCLNIFTPSIQSIIKSSLSFSSINRMWSISNKYLVTSDDVKKKSEIFQIQKSFARLDAKDFINNSNTIALFELEDGNYVIQVTSKSVVLYDSDFNTVATLENELKEYQEDEEIIFATNNDEFILLTLSTGEALIFSTNTYAGSFTKIELPKLLNDVLITTGYITNSKLLSAVEKDISILINRGVKRKHGSNSVSKSKNLDERSNVPKTTLFVLTTGDNRIVVFSRYHKEKCYQLNDVEKFSTHLNLAFFEPKNSMPDPFIKQVVLNTLGKQEKELQDEYLSILTVGGQVILYKLYFDEENYKFIKEKNTTITGSLVNSYTMGTTVERRLVYMQNCGGYSSLFVTGSTPYWITKSQHSIPRIFKFSKIAAASFAPYSDSRIQNGFIYLDGNKNARIGELPNDFNYDNKWPVKRIEIGETVKGITFHQLSNTYSISSYKTIEYNCIDEEGNPIVGTMKTKPSAKSYKGSIKLISPLSWTVIDSIDLEDNEVGMSIKSMNLDVGISQKRFKNKKELIVVGTGKYRIEDLQANGSFKIFEIIDIIPEPGKPETNHKFKEFCTEETRGAVTAICEVSGRMLVSQGQKVIVRDLQDNGVIPVAFLDTSVYVSEAKSFGNLLILGDTLKSIWFAGFDAEPFRMIMLGKDLQKLDVTSADFIVRDEEIFILVADGNNVLHLLKYDPEDPMSLNGQRLIEKASFNINTTVSCLRKLPKNEEINPVESDNFQCIGSTEDGSFFTVFPVTESTYMRMYVLQQQIIDKEYHYCGLNPRLNRFGDLQINSNDSNAKPLLDYDVISIFPNLTEDRKKNLAMKVGSNSYHDVWKDLVEFENTLKNL